MNVPENKLPPSQQYNLKWTNYTSNILQMFAEQFSKESFTDIMLACEGKFIKAHKMVLSACSPYFENILHLYLVPQPMIVMNGIKFKLLKILVDFMYHGEVKVADEDLSSLLELAEQLQVKGLCNVRNKDTKDSKHTPALDSEESATPNTNLNNSRKRRRASNTANNEPLKDQSNFEGVENKNQDKKSENKINDEPTNNKTEGSEQSSDVETRQIIGGILTPCVIQPFQPTIMVTENKEANKNYRIVSTDMLQDYESMKIRRPQNAFMIFANENRKKLASENPGESNKDISVRLGNMWKTLPCAAKTAYYTAAKKANEEHKTKYPGYYYSPKEARLRKEMKNSYTRKNKSMEALQVVQLVMNDNAEDSNQMVYSDCGDAEYDEVDFIHDIKEEEDDVIELCGSNKPPCVQTSASQ